MKIQMRLLDDFSPTKFRAATAGKAPKAWALSRFWVSIHSYKKQPVKKIWGRILGLAKLKFAVAALVSGLSYLITAVFRILI